MIFSVDSPDWLIMHTTKDAMQAELLKNELENNDIKCFIVNKRDNLTIFGVSMLYVEKRNEAVAKVIIEVFTTRNDGETK